MGDLFSSPSYRIMCGETSHSHDRALQLIQNLTTVSPSLPQWYAFAAALSDLLKRLIRVTSHLCIAAAQTFERREQNEGT